MRDQKNRFQKPFDIDMQVPRLGINYMAPYASDYNYCRGAGNMWFSPLGYLETRPSVRRISHNESTNFGPIKGMLYSETRQKLFVAAGTKFCVLDEDNKLTEIGDLTGNNDKVCLLEYLSNIYVASGGVLQVYDGTTLSVPTPAADTVPIPQLDYIQTWQERIFGFKNYTLWGSGYRTADDWGPISADVSTSLGGSIDIRPGDGGIIMGFIIFQGSFYIMKGNKAGLNGSFWTLTGSSFRDDSSDLYSLRLVNEGIGCVDPFTVAPAMNSVLFLGDGGNVYSQVSVDKYAFPQSMPVNQLVQDAFRTNLDPVCATYQPMLGYYFLIMSNFTTLFSEIWCYHEGTGGWWRWTLQDIRPTFACKGPRDELYFGDGDSRIYRLNHGYYGSDGDEDSSLTYVSGFTTYSIDTGNTFDKFWEWLYVSYLPLGGAGQMWVDYREGRGYTFAYTASVLSEHDDNLGVVGWDAIASQWDVPTFKWDMGRSIERRNRINRRAASLQLRLQSNTAFRLIGISLTGGTIARSIRGWTK